MLDARLARIVDSCAEYLRPHEFDDVDLQLINRLEALPSMGAEPAPAFRAGLRAQLLEHAPELLAPAPTDTEAPARVVTALDWRRRWRDLRRPIIAATAVATVFFILMGTSVWLSKRALPGDALYAVKRASEDARISITHGDAAKGKKYLQFASDRLEEISKLIGRSNTSGGSRPSSGRLSDHIQDLVVSTLATLDQQARDGTSLLTKSAVAAGDSAVLAPLAPWASTEQTGLTDIANRLPSGRAKNATKSSLVLVRRVQTRVALLSGSIGCACMSTVNSDDLGPLPCSDECPVQDSTTSRSASTSSTHKQPSTTTSKTPSTSPGGDGGGTQTAPPPVPPATPPTEPPTSDPSSDPGDNSAPYGGSDEPTSDPNTTTDGGATTQAAQTDS
ncbi:MAG TPA: DUF5667 domain-containing protein [Jatrophihabitantaceae bacterium]|nr:DUF5667 domain-containing protein [Jatrophihabitantaceae bacterium]